jgi:hypothetical protein
VAIATALSRERGIIKVGIVYLALVVMEKEP